jgi:hypothetical protein
MKKNVFLMIGFLMLFMSCCFEDCKGPTTPEPPNPPVEPKYFHIQLKYTRPAGSILQPDQVEKIVGAEIRGGQCNWGSCDFGFGFIEMIDDYHFAWSEYQLIPDNENGSYYEMYGIDWAKWDGIHDDTIVVGEIFFIRVKETGFEKQLTNVVLNTLPCNPYKGSNAKMVLWRLKKDGTIADN